MIQAKTSELVGLLVFEVPPGERYQRLMAEVDLNGNGRIDKNETPLAKRALMQRALLGIEFQWNNKALTWTNQDIKLEQKGRRITAVILMTLNEVQTSASTLDIKLGASEGIADIDISINDDNEVTAFKNGKVTSERPFISLHHGDNLQITLKALSETPQPKAPQSTKSQK